MKTVTEFARDVEVREEEVWIPMSDGVRLAARIWLPADAERDPVPALLEYLPYRKRDMTRGRDEPIHHYFAGHGYASVRVDLRGAGDSFGVMHDEYAMQEHDDAVEVIRVARRAALVHGQGRHVRYLLGRLQLPPGGGAAPARAGSDHHFVLDRRPVQRRHALRGRLPAQRQLRLGHDLLLHPAPARGPADHGGGLARELAGPPRERALSGRDLAPAPVP